MPSGAAELSGIGGGSHSEIGLTTGYIVNDAANAQWNSGIDGNIASRDITSTYNEVQARREAARDAAAGFNETFRTWQQNDGLRALGYMSAPALLGATAGVGAAVMPAAAAYFGSNAVAAGMVWGAVGGATSAIEQGAEMLAYRATEGAVGQRDFSVEQLDLGIVTGGLLGPASEIIGPYVDKGASWLINRVTAGGEQAVPASRFTSEQLRAITSEGAPNVPDKVIVPRMNLAEDFSTNTYPNGTREYLIHDPSPEGFSHGFLGRITSEGRMTFTVRAEGDRTLFGSGSDMFDSFMLRAGNDGVPISSITGEWHIGTDSVNAAQYLKGIEARLSPRQAALSTWTGQMAIRHGYTDVYVPEIQAGVVRPVFTRTSQVKP